MSADPMNRSAGLRTRSGAVKDDRPLVDFLYYLLREHLPAGVVEEIATKATFSPTPNTYSNGWLALYAKDVAARLLGLDPSDGPTTEKNACDVVDSLDTVLATGVVPSTLAGARIEQLGMQLETGPYGCQLRLKNGQLFNVLVVPAKDLGPPTS